METHLWEKYRIVSVHLKYGAKTAGSVSDCGMEISLNLNFFSVSPLSQKYSFSVLYHACWVDDKGLGVWEGNNPLDPQNL